MSGDDAIQPVKGLRPPFAREAALLLSNGGSSGFRQNAPLFNAEQRLPRSANKYLPGEEGD